MILLILSLSSYYGTLYIGYPYAIKVNYDNMNDISKYLHNRLSRVITKHDYLKDDDFIMQLQTSVDKWSDYYNIDKELVYAIIHQESSFNKDEVSYADCYGLMQINYNVWKKVLDLEDASELFDIDKNIECGCRILNVYLEKEDRVKSKALVRYFGICPSGKEYSKKVLNKEQWYIQINGGKR